jgi:cytosine/adenosine deaminase-related metal-dependent hydrolase
VIEAAARVGVRVAACYGLADSDPPADRRAALEENLGFARELARRREGRLDAVLGVRASSLPGLERLVQESFDAAGESLAVHVDLGLDSTPAERWRGGEAWPQGTPSALWAHADRAPRALMTAARERGDALSATGAGNLTALARETALAWGSDAGLNAPPLPDSAPAWSGERELAELHYRRVFVSGARWASQRFGERLGVIEPGAPADLMLVDYRPATGLDGDALPAHLAAGMLRAPVSGVMVAGEIVLDQGTLVTIDENEIAARARECTRRVWARLEA